MHFVQYNFVSGTGSSRTPKKKPKKQHQHPPQAVNIIFYKKYNSLLEYWYVIVCLSFVAQTGATCDGRDYRGCASGRADYGGDGGPGAASGREARHCASGSGSCAATGA